MPARLHCDNCDDVIPHGKDAAYRLHDPSGFGWDWHLCSTPCLVKKAEDIAKPATPVRVYDDWKHTG